MHCCILLILVAGLVGHSSSFTSFQVTSRSNVHYFRSNGKIQHDTPRTPLFYPARPRPNTITVANPSTVELSMLPEVLKTVACKVSPTARNIALIGAFGYALVNHKRILWPGSSPDPSVKEPLPEGSLGCPFFGKNVLGGSEFFKKSAAKLGNPRVWKLYFFGRPLTSVSGLDNIKKILNTEFKEGGVRTGSLARKPSEIFGTDSLLMSQDEKLHDFLRRLVGASMTPTSIAAAIPSLEQAANHQIDKMLESDIAVMEDVCTNFTLDIAWRQILGLDLDPSDAEHFHKKVNTWIRGIFDVKQFFVPQRLLRRTRAFKAYRYLVSKIEEKLDKLETNGPDGSTISAMYFAEDEEQTSKKLSRKQIIDNSMLLILAGSETSASTLTNAMYFLGSHPEVLAELKREQIELIQNHGPALTTTHLKECRYLDSVIKETMRIKPLSAGQRFAQGTLTVEGKQIPKGWGVMWNIRQTHEFDPVVRMEDGSHMDPGLGYRPERWLDESTKPKEFLPFGYGPRYCLGANLSLAEMKIFLAYLVRRVDFELIGESKENVEWTKNTVITKPADGVVVSVKKAQPEVSGRSISVEPTPVAML